MKKNHLLLLITLTLFISCSDNNNTGIDEQQTNLECFCEAQNEYVCWELNGKQEKITNLVKDRISDYDSEGRRHYAFRDSNTPKFYIEFEWPTEIIVGKTYNLDLNTSDSLYDFDYGFGEDTIFYTGTFTILENNDNYIRGKFSAKDAKVNGVSANPDIIISNGCFKLLK